MTDFARFFPLRRRPVPTEAGVSSDRRTALADLVDRAAELVGGEGHGHAVFAEAFVDDADLRGDYAAVATHDPATALVALASVVRSGRRRTARSLAAATRALLLLACDLDTEVVVNPGTARMVALHLAASGPPDRRAIVGGHTIRATDADWSFGTGPVLEGTATAIAAFLAGVSDDPPHPPVVSDRG